MVMILPIFYYFIASCCANNRRNMQFSAYNRSMAGAPSHLCNNSSRSFHCRHPIRIGHTGNNNITLLHCINILSIANNTRRAGDNLLPNTLPGYKDL